MPKYQWYFVNKDDDVCKHVINLQNYFDNLFLRLFKPFNFIHSPKHFFKINVD